MRIISAILLVFVSCAVLFAQDTNVAENDSSALTETISPCGDTNEYQTVEGIVKSFSDKNDLLYVEVEVENQRFEVKLAGIKDFAPSRKEMDILAFYLLDRKVKITGNKVDGDKDFTGIITVYGLKELLNINEYILENGIGKYQIPEPNRVPNSITCRFSELEARAKAKKIGVWVK